LRRYADQAWWLCALVPVVAALLCGVCWDIFAHVPFKWRINLLFIQSWWVGLYLARKQGRHSIWLLRLLWIIVGTFFIWIIIERIYPDYLKIVSGLINFLPLFLLQSVSGIIDLIPISKLYIVFFGVVIGENFGVAGGVAGGVAVGVAGGLTASVAGGVGGVAGGVVGGVAWGVVFGVALGVAGGVAVGVTVGVALGVAFGVAFGVAYTVCSFMGIFRIWFWLIEFPAILLMELWTQNGKSKKAVRQRCARVLPLLPFYYDELIYLPLPFLPGLIAGAYPIVPEKTLQTLSHISAFTNLKKTARKAIEIIIYELMDECTNTSEMAEVCNSLTWVGSYADYPPLPNFMDISREIRAAMNATSAFRARQMLEQPLNMLYRLGMECASPGRTIPPGYGAVVERWMAILRTAQKTLAEKAQKEGEIPQAYVAGPSLKPGDSKELFKGRTSVFREIEMLMLSSQRPTLLLYGQRRTGKTSLLRFLPQKLGSGIVPVIIDMQQALQAVTLPGLAKGMAGQIAENIRTGMDIPLPMPDDKGLTADPFVCLGEWFDQIEKRIPEKTILLCLDEFERLQEIVEATGSRAPLNFLRGLTQNHTRWGIMYAGSHSKEDIAEYWSDYLIGTRTVKLDYLNEQEARSLICCPTSDFPDIYLPETFDSIIYWTAGHPMLVQLLCYETVELLNRCKKKHAEPSDVESVFSRAFESAFQYFHEFWSDLKPEEKTVMQILAEQDMNQYPDEKAVQSLIRRGILISTNGNRAIRVPLISRWITEKRYNA
jgi:AAA+ ATPase superfamily predicted ATPase